MLLSIAYFGTCHKGDGSHGKTRRQVEDAIYAATAAANTVRILYDGSKNDVLWTYERHLKVF